MMRISQLAATVLGASAALLAGAAAPGCSDSVGSYCDKRCDCVGCSQPEHDDCVDSLEDDRKAAEDAGCGSEFGDLLSCADSALRCTEGELDTDGCDAELGELLKCDPPETSNACEDAAADYVAHYESCGNDAPASGGSGSTECSAAEGEAAQCAADCYVATSCDYVNGKGTADEAKAYTDCLSDCG